MRNKFLILNFTLLTILMPVSAHAAEYRISGDTFYGCTTKKDYSDIVKLQADNDIEAAKKLLAFGMSMGVCTIFKKGEVVHSASPGVMTVQLRRKGDPTAYWTSISAIKQ